MEGVYAAAVALLLLHTARAVCLAWRVICPVIDPCGRAKRTSKQKRMLHCAPVLNFVWRARTAQVRAGLQPMQLLADALLWAQVRLGQARSGPPSKTV